MIWLIGNKGMLGAELSSLFEKESLNFAGTDREVDITDFNAVEKYAKDKAFEWIINCAAYTAVDKAEDDADLCRNINVNGPQNIGKTANLTKAKVIHISTDYVFNGKGERPYKEDDVTDPIGVYGLSKRDGEVLLKDQNRETYIIRTAWLYGRHGNNFVHTMLCLFNEKKRISVVDDQKGSPTHANDLANIIIKFIKQSNNGNNVPYGIYHYTNDGEITWFEFAKEIYNQARAIGIIKNDCEINPCKSSDYPSKVTRPAYSVLDKTKIKNALNMLISPWNESLKKYFYNSIRN